MKVLILCTGNSCRSQMAHGFLQSFSSDIYVITVCGGANESCPVFVGNVEHRLHIGFDDPSDAIGSDEFVMAEFRRVRDEIKNKFEQFYNDNLK